MTCHQVFQASPHPCETCRTFEVFQTGRPVTWEWVDPKGRVFEFHDSPYADPNGTPLMLEFAFDVTAARRTKPADR
jgi:hypothetical protein